MFTSVSNYFEEEFDTAVDNMSSLIEPIMIVFHGNNDWWINDCDVLTNIQRWCNYWTINNLIIFCKN